MQIKRTVTEKLTDDTGKTITPGTIILYSQKTSTDNVGIFQALQDGFMVMKSVSTKKDYAIRPNNVIKCNVVDVFGCDVMK